MGTSLISFTFGLASRCGIWPRRSLSAVAVADMALNRSSAEALTRRLACRPGVQMVALALLHCEGSGKLDRARSRLYRGQILQENMRLKALAEIYTMHSFAQLLESVHSSVISIFIKFCQMLLNFRQISPFFFGIFPKCSIFPKRFNFGC